MLSRKPTDNNFIPVVGGSSLLVIFAVLCLITFTLLALSTASANLRLSDASAKAITDYYAAEAEAETILARLRLKDIPECVSINNNAEDVVYSYSCPISDTQKLMVEVQVNGNHYTILRWQAVSTVTYETKSD